MAERRLEWHPILPIPDRKRVAFYWQRKKLQGFEGEVISSALFANGIRTFGHHPKDGTALGIYCANGQCAQCTVIANGLPVKACMTRLEEGMILQPVDGLPALPRVDDNLKPSPSRLVETEALIIGGGPAGLSAALELGRRGIKTLLVDDKDRLGGKLVLQTHKFFGSIEDCQAGTRGIDIGRRLASEVAALPSVKVWLNTTALYVFGDQRVGLVKDGTRYRIVAPRVVLVAAGAREKSLVFPGNTLPGVYGAGAFQTLVNRDLVRPAEKLFIVGGGNVGLIAAYHALQAGIRVVGLAEALERCGGYKVHEDKIRRLGVPVHTRHTVLGAQGRDRLESVTIARIDERFRPLPGTERTFECDTLLIAVGLDPVNEFFQEAVQAGLKVFAAGDAKEIAEASSAMFSGRIAGLEMAAALGREGAPVPDEWRRKAEVLKSHPGPAGQPDYSSLPEAGVGPVFHCTQEIPCNPCSTVCPKGVVRVPGDGLLARPETTGAECTGCLRCLFICPGLAISLVDGRADPENPAVSLAYEIQNQAVAKGDRILLTDLQGNPLQEAEVTRVIQTKTSDRTQAVQVRVPREIAPRVAGFRIQAAEAGLKLKEPVQARPPDEAIVCRCERVTVAQVRELIRGGVRDLNQLKAVTRAGMGACGYKTCQPLLVQICRAEGVPPGEVVLNTTRPIFVETPLGVFANLRPKGGRS